MPPKCPLPIRQVILTWATGVLPMAWRASQWTATTCWPSMRRRGKRLQRARGGDGPTLIECRTYRTRAHAEGMRDAGYRTPEEVDAWKERDPIKRYNEWLLENEEAGPETLAAIEEEIRVMVADAEEFARNSPWPEPDTVSEHVFDER